MHSGHACGVCGARLSGDVCGAAATVGIGLEDEVERRRAEKKRKGEEGNDGGK